MVDRLGSSFRDPSGFVYRRSGTLLRQVNVSYAAHFDALIASGLYDELVGERLLVEHGERDIGEAATSDAYRVIEPAPIARNQAPPLRAPQAPAWLKLHRCEPKLEVGCVGLIKSGSRRRPPESM